MLVGGCLRQNGAMSKLGRGLGFQVTPSEDGETLLFALELQPPKPLAQSTCSTDKPREMP